MLLVQPSGASRSLVYRELNEDPKTNPEKISVLKSWIKTQPHLPPFDDDTRLKSFLRGCKFDMEKTKRKIDNYFSMRAAAPEVFSNRDPLIPSVQRVWEETQILPLRSPTADGSRVMWLTSTHPGRLNIASGPENIKLSLMIGDMRLGLEEDGVASDIYVLDASFATMEQFAKFTPAFIKKFLTCVKLAYPARVKQYHVINVNPCVEYTLSLITPLITHKMKNRIHYHGKDYQETLSKFVPQEMWPDEYGGQAGSVKELRAAWRKTIEDYRQWFLDEEKIKTDESKRPGKPINYDELFGIQRNFKKLTID